MTPRSDMHPSNPARPDPDPEPPDRVACLDVDVVQDDDGDWSAFGDAPSAVLGAAKALSDYPGAVRLRCEAAVCLSSDAEVARLNGAYRGAPKPTNVLSFPAPPFPTGAGAVGSRPLGDIILARETILREASESGTLPIHHLQHLVIHGLLHLLGHDHDGDAEAERMETLETAVLASLRIPDPYGDAAP